jgi:hypothetical protein
MSENKNSSKINEFDFEEEPIKGKVVDQSMVGRKQLPINNAIIAGVVIVFILIGLRSGMSGSSTKKEETSQPVLTNSAPALPPQAPPEPLVKSPAIQENSTDIPKESKTIQADRPDQVKSEIKHSTALVEENKVTEKDQALQVILKDVQAMIAKNQKEQLALLEHMNTLVDESAVNQKNLNTSMQQQNHQLQLQLDASKDVQKALSSKVDLLLTKTIESEKQIKHIDSLLVKQAAEFDLADDLKTGKATSKIVVHALIPGRAWLRDQHNKIFSVVEGDEVPGYGKILTIDPRLGTVVTNSGQILRY